MHLLGPRPSRNPELSVEPTYYLFIRTVHGWSATWRNRLREFAELAFLAQVPSELCFHSFGFGPLSLASSFSPIDPFRFSVSFRLVLPPRHPPVAAYLPCSFSFFLSLSLPLSNSYARCGGQKKVLNWDFYGGCFKRGLGLMDSTGWIKSAW